MLMLDACLEMEKEKGPPRKEDESVMFTISLIVKVRQLAGIALGTFLLWVAYQNPEPVDRDWWVGFWLAVALIAPEVVGELLKSWKELRNGKG